MAAVQQQSSHTTAAISSKRSGAPAESFPWEIRQCAWRSSLVSATASNARSICVRGAQGFQDRRLFIVGEIIHNPEVNHQIASVRDQKSHWQE